MIPTNSGRDDIDTWPGEHYKKVKMKAQYVGRVEPPSWRDGCDPKDTMSDTVDWDNAFKTPPPFVWCNECSGIGWTYYPSLQKHEERCHVCINSPLPGWVPQYYTPAEYRDWIRRENNLHDYELPDSTPVWMRYGVNGWVPGYMWEWRLSDGNFDQCVIRTEAGRPPEDQ